jgi:deoxyhypusine synthase
MDSYGCSTPIELTPDFGKATEDIKRKVRLGFFCFSQRLQGVVRGYDFSKGADFDAMMGSFKTWGFQATNLGLAIDEVNKMVEKLGFFSSVFQINWRLSDEPIAEDEMDELRDPEVRKKVRATIFLGYTSNQVSSGNREVIRYLVQNKMVTNTSRCHL